MTLRDMLEVALLFERGYLCLSAVAYVVARYSRTTIVNVLPCETCVESEGERETAAAQAARRRQRKQRVEEEFEVWLVARSACLLFVCCLHFSARTSSDRAAEGESPRRRFPPFVGVDAVVTVTGDVLRWRGLLQRWNCRELLLKEE